MARGAITVKIDGQYDDRDINRAIKDLDGLKSQAAPTSGAMGGLTSAFKTMALAAGGAFAISTVTDFMKESAQEAMKDEQSVRALSQAMENLGMSSKNAVAEELVDSFSKQYAVADDELRPALQALVTATGDLDQSQTLLQASLDLSAAGYGDVTSAASALAKASNGNLTALNRLTKGAIDPAIIKSKDFAAALGDVNRKFGGQAAEAADTYAGKMKALQIAADEAKETIGYALLDALDRVGKALGGTEGAVGAMDNFATGVGELIQSIGFLTEDISGLIGFLRGTETATGDVATATSDAAAAQTDYLGWVLQAIPLVGPWLAGLRAVYADEVALADGIVSKNGAMAQTMDLVRVLGTRMGVFSGDLADATTAEEMAKEAADALRNGLQDLKDALSMSQSIDDFRFGLHHLDEDIAKNVRSFDGWGDAPKKNRDAIRNALSDAQSITDKWAEETGASLEKAKGKYGELAAEVVRTFVKNGFKRKDVIEFMRFQGLWEPEIEAALKGLNVSDESQKLGFLIGTDLAQGVGTGIDSKIPWVNSKARKLVREAEYAARDESQTQSPSIQWAKLGADLAEGLIVGLNSKSGQIEQTSRGIVAALLAGTKEAVDSAVSEVARYSDALKAAKDEVTSWVSSTANDLMGELDLAKPFTEAMSEDGKLNVQAWRQGTAAELNKWSWFTDVLAKVKADGGSDALLAFLRSKGATIGGAMGQAMIDNGLILHFNGYLAAVENAATTTAQSMVPPFMQAGIDQAQANYEGFRDNYRKGGPARKALENLMDNLAESLNRTSTITVRTVYEATGKPPGRAIGGPVSAANPYIVGERGPELFVPDTSGYVVANNDLRGGVGMGGTTKSYNITVNAGVGDKRQIGREIVELITAYERSNSPVYAKAS